MFSVVAAAVRSVRLKSSHVITRRHISVSFHLLYTSVEESKKDEPKEKIMDDYFIEPYVQSLLKQMTRLDMEKMFKPRHTDNLYKPTYKFVTDKQLAAMKQDAKFRAYARLQMPPVMEVNEDEPVVLSVDPELQGYEESNFLFIDISLNVPERERMITVREPDGTLRYANRKERLRMNQTFFPREGRTLDEPIMFQSPYLEKLLDEGSYIFVLDRACIQYDPDDAEYHAVTKPTYEHISANKKFHELRSTRHFGPMAFYLAWNNKTENLLIDMIERELIKDAAYLVKLLYVIHPELWPGTREEIKELKWLDLVKDFIARNTSEQKPHLELAIQTYLDTVAHRNKEADDAIEANVSSS